MNRPHMLPTLARRALRTLATLALGAALAACGGGGDADSGGNGGASAGGGATPAPSSFSTAPQLAAGHGFSLALRRDGSVFAWGSQSLGELGNGQTSDSTRRPGQALGLEHIRQISAGASHSLALRDDGTVFAWGLNNDGRLGLGFDRGLVPVAQPVAGLPRMKAVAAGGDHSLALAEDGRVFAWGLNDVGQLGLGDTVTRLSPVAVAGLSDVVAIAAGGAHALALQRDGRLFAWGLNASGQLGNGDNADRLRPAAVAGLSTFVLREIAAGTAHSLARLADGRVFAWGAGSFGQAGRSFADFSLPGAVPGVANAAALAAGERHSLVLLADGRVLAFGAAGDGRLGNGVSGNSFSDFRPSPMVLDGGVVAIAAGQDHSLVAVASGAVGCSGSNFLDQCGFVGSGSSVPTEVGPGFSVGP